MSLYGRRAVAAFGLLAVLCAGVARASSAGSRDPRFVSPAGHSRLEPGLSLRIAWDRPVEHPGEREMELLFSADGGRTFPLRLTRDLSLDTDQFVWRVPALPTAHARLALRVGDDEDPGEERIVSVSEEFTIEVSASPGSEILFRTGTEWRTEEAARGNPRLPLVPDLGSEPAGSIRASSDSVPAMDTPPGPALPSRSSSRTLPFDRLAAASAASRNIPALASPALALRI